MTSTLSNLGSLLRRQCILGGRWSRQFRLSAETASPAGLKLILIRHGESQNNVLQQEVEDRVRAGKMTPDEATQEWYARRVTDPPLSAKGEREAKLLSKYLGTRLVQTGGAVLVSSPMLRALQTVAPLQSETQYQCIVMPDCYEVGGIYDSSGVVGGGSPPALSALDISQRFPGYDTSMLPQTGPWNHEQKQKEPKSEWADRAVKVSDWLQSPKVRDTADGRPLVMVLHSTFQDLLIKALLTLPMTHADEGGPFFFTDNTSMTSIFIPQTWADGELGPGPTLQSLNLTPHIPPGGA